MWWHGDALLSSVAEPQSITKGGAAGCQAETPAGRARSQHTRTMSMLPLPACAALPALHPAPQKTTSKPPHPEHVGGDGEQQGHGCVAPAGSGQRHAGRERCGHAAEDLQGREGQPTVDFKPSAAAAWGLGGRPAAVQRRGDIRRHQGSRLTASPSAISGGCSGRRSTASASSGVAARIATSP